MSVLLWVNLVGLRFSVESRAPLSDIATGDPTELVLPHSQFYISQ